MGFFKKFKTIGVSLLKPLDSVLVVLCVLAVKGYQATLSPDHGLIKGYFRYGFCRFRPTCSEYAILVLRKYGFFLGIPRVVWRVLRCVPWGSPAVDLP